MYTKQNENKQTLRICNLINRVLQINAFFQQGSSHHNYFERKASLAIEASVVIPIFMIAMMSLISILAVINIDIRIRNALYEESRYISMMQYDHPVNDVQEIENRVLDALGNGIVTSPFIDNSRGGIDFSDSDLTNKEVLNLVVHYNARIPFDIAGYCHCRFTERIVVHTWVGYINGLNGYRGNDAIVYITDSGQVFHRNINCTHIKLNIVEVAGSEIPSIRNVNGSKYKKCEICDSNLSDPLLYVTSDGTKYHNRIACSGITRNIRAVHIYEVLNRRPCTRCGY